MQKRLFRDTGKEISILGMGGMRFPTLENGEIDAEKAEEIIDYAYANGVNYFDTAYMYHDGKSEVFMGKALKKYPRESYYLTDKMPVWMADSPEGVEKIFKNQLERCDVDYFDFYLCHALDSDNFARLQEFKTVDFLLEKKKEGKIKHLGFSFHDTPEVLEQILKAYPWEFCQLQLNYFDWDYQNAKSQYELCVKYGVQVVVMEPVRGGALADLGEEANAYLREINPDRSIASWAIRYAMQGENILTVLSGMSTIEQTKDNVNTAKGEINLNEREKIALQKALAEYKKSKQIPCTGCNYCAGCPVGIDIRNMFKIYNADAFNKGRGGFKKEYAKLDEDRRADKCIKCGKCARVCPQSIDIPSEMEKICKIVG